MTKLFEKVAQFNRKPEKITMSRWGKCASGWKSNLRLI